MRSSSTLSESTVYTTRSGKRSPSSSLSAQWGCRCADWSCTLQSKPYGTFALIHSESLKQMLISIFVLYIHRLFKQLQYTLVSSNNTRNRWCCWESVTLQQLEWQHMNCVYSLLQGDQRTHSHVVALRAVTSSDGMTADWCALTPQIPIPDSKITIIKSEYIVPSCMYGPPIGYWGWFGSVRPCQFWQRGLNWTLQAQSCQILMPAQRLPSTDNIYNLLYLVGRHDMFCGDDAGIRLSPNSCRMWRLGFATTCVAWTG